MGTGKATRRAVLVVGAVALLTVGGVALKIVLPRLLDAGYHFTTP